VEFSYFKITKQLWFYVKGTFVRVLVTKARVEVKTYSSSVLS